MEEAVTFANRVVADCVTRRGSTQVSMPEAVKIIDRIQQEHSIL